MRNHLLTIALASSMIFQPAYAEEDSDVLGTLAAAKMAGACGIMDSQIDFQTKTKMDGGDEFVARFWFIEATRLGKSMEEYFELCKSSVSIYDKIWKASEEYQEEKPSK
jgi:hypothetical protein